LIDLFLYDLFLLLLSPSLALRFDALGVRLGSLPGRFLLVSNSLGLCRLPLGLHRKDEK
jgi:hypothetical protein